MTASLDAQGASRTLKRTQTSRRTTPEQTQNDPRTAPEQPQNASRTLQDDPQDDRERPRMVPRMLSKCSKTLQLIASLLVSFAGLVSCWLVGCLARWLDGWLVSGLVVWLVGWLFGCWPLAAGRWRFDPGKWIPLWSPRMGVENRTHSHAHKVAAGVVTAEILIFCGPEVGSKINSQNLPPSRYLDSPATR